MFSCNLYICQDVCINDETLHFLHLGPALLWTDTRVWPSFHFPSFMRFASIKRKDVKDEFLFFYYGVIYEWWTWGNRMKGKSDALIEKHHGGRKIYPHPTDESQSTEHLPSRYMLCGDIFFEAEIIDWDSASESVLIPAPGINLKFLPYRNRTWYRWLPLE